MDIKKLNEELEKYLKEEFRLMDKEDPSLGLGAAYIVDTKEELIQHLDDLIIGDSIAIKQEGDKEITINFEDENDYSFLIDNGTLENNWNTEEVGRTWYNLTKEEILDLIDVEVK